MPEQLRRGDIVIAGERGAFTGKLRPWVVVQSGEFLDEPSTVTACMMSTLEQAAVFRIAITADGANGLDQDSVVLVDKVVTLRVGAIVRRVGGLSSAAMVQVDHALRRWLDL